MQLLELEQAEQDPDLVALSRQFKATAMELISVLEQVNNLIRILQFFWGKVSCFGWFAYFPEQLKTMTMDELTSGRLHYITFLEVFLYCLLALKIV
jgi:hypothetical protein